MRGKDLLDDCGCRLPCIHIVNAEVRDAVVLDVLHRLRHGAHCHTDVRVVALFVADLHDGRADGGGSREEQGKKEGDDGLHFGDWMWKIIEIFVWCVDEMAKCTMILESKNTVLAVLYILATLCPTPSSMPYMDFFTRLLHGKCGSRPNVLSPYDRLEASRPQTHV